MFLQLMIIGIDIFNIFLTKGYLALPSTKLIAQPANDGGKCYSKIFCYLHSKAELAAIRAFTEAAFFDPTEVGIFDVSDSNSRHFSLNSAECFRRISWNSVMIFAYEIFNLNKKVQKILFPVMSVK
jgi:hypothetical protein